MHPEIAIIEVGLSIKTAHLGLTRDGALCVLIQVALSEDKSPELPNLCGGEDCSSQVSVRDVSSHGMQALIGHHTRVCGMCVWCAASALHDPYPEAVRPGHPGLPHVHGL